MSNANAAAPALPSITQVLTDLPIGGAIRVGGMDLTKIGEGGFENATGGFWSRTEVFCLMMNEAYGPLKGRSWFVR